MERIRKKKEIKNLSHGQRIIREHKLDCILAVGGGSVIDACKGMATAHEMDDPWLWFSEKRALTSGVPIYTCLTLSATGTEMNGISVVSNDEAGVKLINASPHVIPLASFLDPSYQAALPWYETVNGAVDSLVHSAEYMLASTNEPMEETTIGLTGGIMRSVIKSCDRIKADEKDYAPRAALAYAATLALNGTTAAGMNGGCWVTHWMQHTVGAIWHNLSHGAGLGVILPAWIEWLHKNKQRPEALRRWAQETFGVDDVLVATRKWREMLVRWGHPTTLRQYIGAEHAPDTPEGKERVVNQISELLVAKHLAKADQMTVAEAKEIYGACW
jgi:alcohol dehydrogenase YqhD (iron-dependent ADH family)